MTHYFARPYPSYVCPPPLIIAFSTIGFATRKLSIFHSNTLVLFPQRVVHVRATTPWQCVSLRKILRPTVQSYVYLVGRPARKIQRCSKSSTEQQEESPSLSSLLTALYNYTDFVHHCLLLDRILKSKLRDFPTICNTITSYCLYSDLALPLLLFSPLKQRVTRLTVPTSFA